MDTAGRTKQLLLFCPSLLGTSPTEDLCPLLEAGRDGPTVFISCFGAAQPDAWIAPSPMRLISSILAFWLIRVGSGLSVLSF